MYCETPKLGRIRFGDNPTTAIVRYLRRILLMSAIGALHLQRTAKSLHLGFGQMPPLARLHVKIERADLHPPQLLHQASEVLEHDTNLILPPLRQSDLVPRSSSALN